MFNRTYQVVKLIAVVVTVVLVNAPVAQAAAVLMSGLGI